MKLPVVLCAKKARSAWFSPVLLGCGERIKVNDFGLVQYSKGMNTPQGFLLSFVCPFAMESRGLKKEVLCFGALMEGVMDYWCWSRDIFE